MSVQERKKISDKRTGEKTVQPNPDTVQKGNELKKDMDELLDQIDNVLEENAEEFVRSYVQRGGE